jgi:hypothetical protein
VLEAVRWTGRPGYPVRAMVGICLVKSLYAIPTWSRTVALVAEHPALQTVLGCAPSQWACYRFAKMLRTRDGWALGQAMNDVLGGLRAEMPNLGQRIAIDGSDLPAYANGQRGEDKRDNPNCSDPDASWGHRSAVSTRAAGGYFGFKLHAAVDVDTDLPLAWSVETAKRSEVRIAPRLMDTVRKRGMQPAVAIMDKGYDGTPMHDECMFRGILPVIPVKDTPGVRQGKAGAPTCEHGKWTFCGADFGNRRSKWRCPTGECQPKSMWLKADRLHPLIPRESKRYRDLYAKRGSVERQFGRLKHEWSLLPLRTRGLDQVRLHADLTILACLASRLAQERARAVPLAA